MSNKTDDIIRAVQLSSASNEDKLDILAHERERLNIEQKGLEGLVFFATVAMCLIGAAIWFAG